MFGQTYRNSHVYIGTSNNNNQYPQMNRNISSTNENHNLKLGEKYYPSNNQITQHQSNNASLFNNNQLFSPVHHASYIAPSRKMKP